MCVLRGEDGRDGVRLAVDYRNVNRFTRNDVFLLLDLDVYFNVVIAMILYVLLIVRPDLGTKYFV